MKIRIKTKFGMATVHESTDDMMKVVFDKKVALNGRLSSYIWLISSEKLKEIRIK